MIRYLMAMALPAMLLAGSGSARPAVELLSGLKVESPFRYENLTVFALSGAGAGGAEYVLLDEAIDAGSVKVREKNGGIVNTVQMRNDGKGFVFGIAGEIVSGARQDRMLQDDVLLPPGSGWIDVPVYCTEHGRWEGTQEFGTKRHIAAGRVRERAARSGSQAEVWAEVDAARAALDVKTPTQALARVYDEPRVQRKVQAYEQHLARVPELCLGARGVLVAVGSRVVCVDAFGSPALFRKMWPKLLRSYVIDAVSQRPAGRLHVEQAAGFLRAAAQAAFAMRPTAGAGTSFRIHGARVSGSALVHGPRVVHLDLFSTSADGLPDDRPVPRLQFRRERSLD